jgi:hypothetical protein
LSPWISLQLREEGPVTQIGDVHRRQLHPHLLEHVHEQVVGQRARRLDPLQREGDRGRLDRADPDRQVARALALLQQHDRLVRRQLHPDADELHLDHRHAPVEGR